MLGNKLSNNVQSLYAIKFMDLIWRRKSTKKVKLHLEFGIKRSKLVNRTYKIACLESCTIWRLCAISISKCRSCHSGTMYTHSSSFGDQLDKHSEHCYKR